VSWDPLVAFGPDQLPVLLPEGTAHETALVEFHVKVTVLLLDMTTGPSESSAFISTVEGLGGENGGGIGPGVVGGVGPGGVPVGITVIVTVLLEAGDRGPVVVKYRV
jgi:hypothetical protein